MKRDFLGYKLRLARTFHNMTLAEVGDMVAASRQYMQRLETNDETCPSGEMLAALSEVLKVDESFFFDQIDEVREDQGHFRKLQTTPLKVRSTVLSYGTVFTILVKHLENYLELPPLNVPKIEVSSRSDIERAAETCRKAWGVGLDAPIVNMVRTIERAGIVVTSFEGVSEKVDAFSLVRGRPVIVRNLDKDSTSRSRFDLAHECGHFVMHDGIVTGEPETEAEANNFASAFVLPRAAFLREFPKTTTISWPQMFEMKKRWGASLQAIVRRAYDLGILSPVQYRNAQVYISRMQWRKNEPHEPAVETPEIIPAAITYLRDEEGITVADLARALHVNPEMLKVLGVVDLETELS
jgi:Zn-dependent peptidase ImmA (M78 family)/transcriptional regulator with XRE-family HTH domain